MKRYRESALVVALLCLLTFFVAALVALNYWFGFRISDQEVDRGYTFSVAALFWIIIISFISIFVDRLGSMRQFKRVVKCDPPKSTKNFDIYAWWLEFDIDYNELLNSLAENQDTQIFTLRLFLDSNKGNLCEDSKKWISSIMSKYMVATANLNELSEVMSEWKLFLGE